MSRLPERDTRAGATNRRFKWRPSNALIAVIFILIFTIGPYLAFTGHVPFTSYGYQLKATFSNGVNIATNSPVRIAGVNVGQVISTERDGDATTVTFTVEGKGRPVHDDAFAAIRPRIFLEGNFFVDLSPGSPSAPELGSGDTIPISHTSTWVQIDEVLTALQAPVRADLGHLLEGYGTALTHKPTAAEDETQEPEVQGKTGAEGLNGGFRYGGDAGRYSSEVTNALLGTEPHDLSKLVAGSARTFGALAKNEEDLKGLIVNFNTFTGALAAQSANLSTTVHRLSPTLQNFHSSLVSLNESLPPLRAWAIEMNPAVAEIPALIKAGLGSNRRGRCSPARRPAARRSCCAKRRPALPAPPRRARQWRCRSSTGSASARPRSSSRPATRRSTTNSALAVPTIASSSTRSPTSPAGVRTSTAMGPSCASSRAAATCWSARRTNSAI